MKEISFVRTEMLGSKAPPPTSVGVIGWMRQNLFNGWLNSILTVVFVVFVGWILTMIVPWIFSPTWNGTSLTDCREIVTAAGREGGACWGVIHERWPQMLFGFYPIDERWRPILTFGLLFIALIPVLFSMISRRMNWVLLLVVLFAGTFAAEGSVLVWAIRAVLAAGAVWTGIKLVGSDKSARASAIAGGAKRLPNPLIFTALFPFIAPWLLWGGSVWGPLLVLVGFIVAYLVYRLVAAAAGSLVGTIVSVVAALVWWLVFAGMISSGVSQSLGASRIESTKAALLAEAALLQVEVDERSAENTTTFGENAAVPRDLARAQGILQRRNELLNRINSLPEAEAGVAALVARQAELKAEMPAALAGVSKLDQMPAGTSAEDQAKVEELIGLDRDIIYRQDQIDVVYERVGLVGLEPVSSRDFGGLLLSLAIGVVAIGASLPLGIVLALGRQSDLLLVKWMSVGFIEFIRGVPLITLLFVASTLLNYFMPPGTNFDIILRVMIMATLFSAAYMAEVIRGGLAALPKGQYEAADALGLDYWKAQRLIIMPQALKISIPGIVSTFIGMFKDTTLVSIIGLLDPVGLTRGILSDSSWHGIVWEIYAFVALMFFVFTFSMSRYSMYLERRLRTDHR